MRFTSFFGEIKKTSKNALFLQKCESPQSPEFTTRVKHLNSRPTTRCLFLQNHRHSWLQHFYKSASVYGFCIFVFLYFFCKIQNQPLTLLLQNENLPRATRGKTLRDDFLRCLEFAFFVNFELKVRGYFYKNCKKHCRRALQKNSTFLENSIKVHSFKAKVCLFRTPKIRICNFAPFLKALKNQPRSSP